MATNDLVTLDEAKEQLRIDGTDSDVELALMVTAASSIVASYLKAAPAVVLALSLLPEKAYIKTCALLVLSSLYGDREGATDPIGPAVASILRRDRDPALA